MNKRIKELALQAGYEVDMFGVGHWDMPECKKFAELIVKECAEVGKQSITRGYGMAISQHALPDYVKEKIQEHFGVK
jgi:hypothetical protein